MVRVAINRRSRNLLNYHPAKDWSNDEAEKVLGALNEIVKGRQDAAR